MTINNQSPAVRTLTLPKGITMKDLERVSYDSKDRMPYGDNESFEIWLLAGFGWVIPTLAIARNGQRTYAVALAEGNARRVSRGAQIRCGLGPHVTAQLTVYVRKSTQEKMAPFFALRNEGAIDANTTRTRISSRRAQGQVERAEGNRSWRWDV
jgi:hypothetical protein